MTTQLRTAVTLLATLVLASAATAIPVGAASRPTASASSSFAPLPYLHVVVPATGADHTPYLADPEGRQVLLHGAAVVGLEDVAYPGANGGPALFPVSAAAYDRRCPKAEARIPQPPLCEVEASRPAYAQSAAPGSGDDFAEMRALGFNVIRLVLNWSQLEPQRGRYSATFLNRVVQVVGWARQQGIYVILDMHQDEYSRFILPASASQNLPGGCKPSGGADGAPRWAVMTDGQPGCALIGQSEVNPAMGAAFFHFWHNTAVGGGAGQSPGRGLEDHFIGALAALARRFEHEPAVLGYELINEPQPGSLSYPPLENLYKHSSEDLYPFYTRAIEALTGVRDGHRTCPTAAPTSLSGACAYPKLASVARQLIFFEPSGYRNLVDFSPQVSAPFSSYRNLVAAPHVYTHTFTVDSFIGYTPANSPYPASYDFGYQTAEADAQAEHAALLTTEFGDNSGSDSTVLSGELAAQEDTLTGGTIWAWKGLSAVQGDCWCVRWQHTSFHTTSQGTPGSGNPHAPVTSLDQLIPSRGLYLARVSARATAGRLLAERYDPLSRSFAMLATDTAAVRRGDRGSETVVYIPSTVRGAVAASGLARLDTVLQQPDGSRLAYVAPTGGHAGAPQDYEVTVGNPPAAVNQAVKTEAAMPPVPISEPVARAAAEQFLIDAASSTDAGIRAKDAQAQPIANLLLGMTDPNTVG